MYPKNNSEKTLAFDIPTFRAPADNYINKRPQQTSLKRSVSSSLCGSQLVRVVAALCCYVCSDLAVVVAGTRRPDPPTPLFGLLTDRRHAASPRRRHRPSKWVYIFYWQARDRVCFVKALYCLTAQRVVSTCVLLALVKIKQNEINPKYRWRKGKGWGVGLLEQTKHRGDG